MSDKDDSHFDDPALKAALGRAYEGERAPAHLRQRIVSLMVASEAAPAPPSSAGRWRSLLGPNPKRMLIAAGVAFLGVMLAAYQVKEYLLPQSDNGGGGYAATELPSSFAIEMVRTHENCAKLPDHHLVAGDDLVKLKEALAKAVNVPVSAMNLSGWQFKGAGTCKVGEIVSAHLLYANAQGQEVSIFELPADAVYGAPHGAKYSQTVEGHAVSGLRHGSGLYCVVGSAGATPMTMAQVEELRDLVSAQLPEVGCGSGRGETVAGL